MIPLKHPNLTPKVPPTLILHHPSISFFFFSYSFQSHIREVFGYIFFQYFLRSFLSLSPPSWTL